MNSQPSSRATNRLPMTFGLMLGLTLLTATNIKAQGPLANGFTYEATIAPIGNVDVWTFSANAGDQIVIRAGEITQTNTLTVRLTLMNPSGVQVATSSGSFSTEIMVTATNSGTFTLNVDDVGADETGQYRLTLAKTGEAVVTAAGDEGGVLTPMACKMCAGCPPVTWTCGLSRPTLGTASSCGRARPMRGVPLRPRCGCFLLRGCCWILMLVQPPGKSHFERQTAECSWS
jgi:hypothetical protein